MRTCIELVADIYEIIKLVMNIEYIKSVYIELAERFFIIDEYGLDRIDFCSGDFCKESALEVSV